MAETYAVLSQQLAPRSLWRDRLTVQAAPLPLDSWLIAQANLRGLRGAWWAGAMPPLDPSLSLEDIVVGLCTPATPADGRVLKLVLRILQAGHLDHRHLGWLARRERADRVLYWLLSMVPAAERTAAVDEVGRLLALPPRGYRAPAYRYDPQRLVRRPHGSGRRG